MKKRLLIFISSLLIILIICWAIYYCVSKDYLYMNNSDKIISADCDGFIVGLVNEKGNCYVKGYITDKNNFGVNNPPASFFRHDRYLQIYDKGDAKDISISASGGAIITDDSDVYIFLNNNEDYKVPKYFTSGYKQVCAFNPEHIYLLSENGDFGFVSIEHPLDFTLLCKNVIKFVVEMKHSDMVAYALTEDERLYFIDKENNNDNRYISNIIDFDVLCPYSEMSIISLLDKTNTAYYSMGDYDLSFENLSDKTLFSQCGTNIRSVSSYDRGIAMIDHNNAVHVCGYDYSSVQSELIVGNIIASDVSKICGDDSNLIIIKQNGTFEVFGYNSNKDEYTNYEILASKEI